jgi:hypothetical protein
MPWFWNWSSKLSKYPVTTKPPLLVVRECMHCPKRCQSLTVLPEQPGLRIFSQDPGNNVNRDVQHGWGQNPDVQIVLSVGTGRYKFKEEAREE